MHKPIIVKSPNNTSKWQMGFNSAFKGLIPMQYVKEGTEGASLLASHLKSQQEAFCP
jgi:hypothetical protein